MSRVDQLTKLLEADPTDADLPYMLAMEHVKAGDRDAALRWLDRTLSIDSDYHYAHYQRALLLHGAGRDDEALTALDKGIANADAAGDQKALSELRDLRGVIGAG